MGHVRVPEPAVQSRPVSFPTRSAQTVLAPAAGLRLCKRRFFLPLFRFAPPKNGNDIAQHSLGLFSMEEVIVPKNEVEGQTAQSASASFYASGLVVAADNVEAFKRMLISGAHNDATTKEVFEAVERLLIRKLRIIGQYRAKGFIPH